MKRKVVRWTAYTPATVYVPTLACGHTYMGYDEIITEEEMITSGNEFDCYDCERLLKRLKIVQDEEEELMNKLGIR